MESQGSNASNVTQWVQKKAILIPLLIPTDDFKDPNTDTCSPETWREQEAEKRGKECE